MNCGSSLICAKLVKSGSAPLATLYALRIGYFNDVDHSSPAGGTGAASWSDASVPVVMRSYPPSPGLRLKSPMRITGMLPDCSCAYIAASCEWMVITFGLRNIHGMW